MPEKNSSLLRNQLNCANSRSFCEGVKSSRRDPSLPLNRFALSVPVMLRAELFLVTFTSIGALRLIAPICTGGMSAAGHGWFAEVVCRSGTFFCIAATSCDVTPNNEANLAAIWGVLVAEHR